MASLWSLRVSLQAGCFETLRFSKMQIPFITFSCHQILHHFFQILLCYWQTIFCRCKDFGYLWQMLICFTMGGGLEHFWRTRCHIFLRVTICIATRITIHFWEFCTVCNALPLLAHYQICYCMPYHTFSVNLVPVCIILHALPCFTISSVLIKSILVFFFLIEDNIW